MTVCWGEKWWDLVFFSAFISIPRHWQPRFHLMHVFILFIPVLELKARPGLLKACEWGLLIVCAHWQVLSSSGTPGRRCWRVLNSAADRVSGLKVTITGMPPFPHLRNSQWRSQCLVSEMLPCPTSYSTTTVSPYSTGRAFPWAVLEQHRSTSVGRQVVTALFLVATPCNVFSGTFVFFCVCIVWGA